MPAFTRSFKHEALADWSAARPGNAVDALFRRWALPGEESTDGVPLRLGVRAGYLNFYFKGQSVAKLAMGRDGPRLSVHTAYAEPAKRSASVTGVDPSQDYVAFNACGLAEPATAKLVQDWIDAARPYASAEKRFVDDLVAANPGVIDLEMGLPASDLEGSDRVAPRMDLVVAQPPTDGSPSIAFWEAKCARNSELRSSSRFEKRADGTYCGPKVLAQIRRYVQWMEQPGRADEVRKAFKDTASCLLAFVRHFRGEMLEAQDCIRIWRTLADAKAVTIVMRPAIVIGAYWPKGSTEGIASERMRQAARSFVSKGHRDVLVGDGVRVHIVGEDHEGRVLPRFDNAVMPA